MDIEKLRRRIKIRLSDLDNILANGSYNSHYDFSNTTPHEKENRANFKDGYNSGSYDVLTEILKMLDE